MGYPNSDNGFGVERSKVKVMVSISECIFHTNDHYAVTNIIPTLTNSVGVGNKTTYGEILL